MKKPSYYILVGIPKHSDTFEYEYVYGDGLLKVVQAQQRFEFHHSDMKILEIDDGTAACIKARIDKENGGGG